MIIERTRAGSSAARAQGRVGGRKHIQSHDPKVLTAKRMHEDRSLDIAEICRMIKVSRATFYRYLQKTP
ncbi:MAG: recombinase family protein [Alphaproteobacteria bacterium]|nr:recombinase family protein [Alphaproteobacteria bacterium]